MALRLRQLTRVFPCLKQFSRCIPQTLDIHKFRNGNQKHILQTSGRSLATSEAIMAKAKEKITVHFLMGDGTRQTVQADVGSNLLDVVIDEEVDIDGFGACEGTLACSTCHLIFKQPDYDKLPEQPTDEELDMLDLAYGLTETSRLGCQVILTKDMDGLEVQVPAGVSDARG